MTKIIKNTKRQNRHGGLEFVYRYFLQIGLDKLIEDKLGDRVAQCKYSIFDVICVQILNTLAGSGRIAHINKKKEDLSSIKGLKIPSIPTITRVLRKLAVEDKIVPAKRGEHAHVFNTHEKLTDLLVHLALKLKLIAKNGKENILDYDNTVIESKKRSATKTYKQSADKVHKRTGHQPGVGTIKSRNGFNIPVYFEGRSGHSTANTRILESHIDCIERLNKYGIKVHWVRGDAASCVNDLLQYLDDNGIKYVIKKRRSSELDDDSKWEIDESEWDNYAYGNKKYGQLASATTWIKHKGGSENWTEARLIVRRSLDINDEHRFSYIITNDWTSSKEKIWNFYNARAHQEKFFGETKDDWNIKKPPFSEINENTVFWLVQCIGYIIYKHLVKKFSSLSGYVDEKWYLRNFIKYVIDYIVTYNDDDSIEVFTDNEEVIQLYGMLSKGLK